METTRRGFFGVLAGAMATCVAATKVPPIAWKSKLWTARTPDIAPVEYGFTIRMVTAFDTFDWREERL